MPRVNYEHASAASPALRSSRHVVSGIQGRPETSRRGAVRWSAGSRQTPSPGASLDYTVDEGTLRISIEGSLDLRCAFALLLMVQAVDDSISSCVLDVSAVEQVFDSGIAALVSTAQALTDKGVDKIRIQGLDLQSAILQPFLS
jgi:ABC-type transporter Mla MlaB component